MKKMMNSFSSCFYHILLFVLTGGRRLSESNQIVKGHLHVRFDSPILLCVFAAYLLETYPTAKYDYNVFSLTERSKRKPNRTVKSDV
jgi:hypothetical protein